MRHPNQCRWSLILMVLIIVLLTAGIAAAKTEFISIGTGGYRWDILSLRRRRRRNLVQIRARHQGRGRSHRRQRGKCKTGP